MQKLSKGIIVPIIGVMFCLLTSTHLAAEDNKPVDDIFPIQGNIQKAVNFWIKIYSQYSTHQGLIHDSRNLDRIYAVIELENPKEKGAARRNRHKIKQIKKKYRDILRHLARGKSPATEEEKKIVALFGDNASPNQFNKASHHVRFQLGQKDRFIKGIIRSGAYLDQIKEIFRNNGLPEDLAYLAHVESSFDYRAYSKFGAAGIWQFTYSTGRRFMTIDYTRDDRRDPISATHAAASHLKENYQELKHWPLAITAYNHGLNGMKRAKAHYGTDFNKIVHKYNSRTFGFASRNFYAEFLAARQVAKNYQQYFGELTLNPKVPSIEVKVPGYVAVKDIADYFKTDLKTIRKLNLALRDPVFSGQKRVPKGYALRLPPRMAGLADDIPQSIFHKKQIPSRFYRVQRGDTAGTIARNNGVKLSSLILANKLDSRARIYVGQNLRIPTTEESIMLAAAVETPSPEKSTPVIEKPSESAPVIQQPEPANASSDSAANLPVDLAYNKTLLDRAAENVAETEAQIPASSSEHKINPDILIGDFKLEKVVTQGKKQFGILRVAAGETLGHYADWLGIPTQRIRRLNGMRYGIPIRTNQVIKIPLTKSNREDFEEKRYEYHKELEEDFFSAYKIESETDYTVKRGDNIWSLCQQTFELPFWLVQRFNTDLDFNLLKPGQKIKLPVVQKTIEDNGNNDS